MLILHDEQLKRLQSSNKLFSWRIAFQFPHDYSELVNELFLGIDYNKHPNNDTDTDDEMVTQL